MSWGQGLNQLSHHSLAAGPGRGGGSNSQQTDTGGIDRAAGEVVQAVHCPRVPKAQLCVHQEAGVGLGGLVLIVIKVS